MQSGGGSASEEIPFFPAHFFFLWGGIMFKDAVRMQPDSTRLAGCTGCNQDAAWDVISNHDGFVTEQSCSVCPTGGWAALMQLAPFQHRDAIRMRTT